MFKNAYARREFFSIYLRSMVAAAVVFGVTHGAQALISGLIANRSLNINPTGFLVLAPYEIIQAVVFLLIGIPLGYAPSALVANLMGKKRQISLLLYVLAGVTLGIVFLPVCACVPYFVLPLPDSPSYLGRCAEFLLPMVLAGACGGAICLRQVEAMPNRAAIADQF